MNQPVDKDLRELERYRGAALSMRNIFNAAAAQDIAVAMNGILADVFALYVKTKNFHWHVSGPHFRDYHVLLDEQADQLYAMTDPIAERIRKVGGSTLKSIGHIARTQRVPTTMQIGSSRTTCSPSCARTTGISLRVCARRTTCATGTATSPAPA